MITIGFPVYNVEKYVSRSFTSALNQDMEDFEIIVVDDCGTDNSIALINKIIESHPKGCKTRIIKHERNKGLAEARNTVIKNANGEYIYFMDSDDFIVQNTLSLLLQSAETYQADVVFSSNYKQEGEKKWIENNDILPDRKFLKEGEFVNYVYMTPNALIPNTVWNILFRTSFLLDNHLLFPNIRYQEDIAFNELYHPLVKKAIFISTPTYYYVIRRDSLMSKCNREHIGIEEAQRAFQLCEEIKKSCNQWKNESFYSGKCAIVMRNCFYNMGGLIKHRKKFNASLSNKNIRNAMKHPASFSDIIGFKHKRKENLFFYLLGILPSFITTKLIEYTSVRRGHF